MINLKTERKKGYRDMVAMALVFMLCFGIFLSVRAKETVTELSGQGTVTADSTLNVRKGPGKDYEKIDSVKPGDSLRITGKSDNGWYEIEINGKTGYVSDQYVELWAEPEEQEKEAGEPEEGYRGLRQSPFVIKIEVIAGVILVVLIMIVLTLRGMGKTDRDEEEDEEDEDEDDEYEDEGDEEEYEDEEYEEYGDDEYEDEEYGDGEYEDEEDIREKIIRQTKRETKTYVIREEDYRVNIDPSFFDTKTSIEQPPAVTGYLDQKEIEKAIDNGKDTGMREVSSGRQSKQEELDKAMEKLNELQKEIERLKKQ